MSRYAASPKTHPILPVEILDSIMDQVDLGTRDYTPEWPPLDPDNPDDIYTSRSGKHGLGRQSLLAMSRVSRDCLTRSRYRLFNSVTLCFKSKEERAKRFLELVEHPKSTIGACIWSLEIKFPDRKGYDHTGKGGDMWWIETLDRVVNMGSTLQILELHNARFDMLDDEILPSFFAGLSQVHTLRFKMCIFSTFRNIVKAFNAVPQLRKFHAMNGGLKCSHPSWDDDDESSDDGNIDYWENEYNGGNTALEELSIEDFNAETAMFTEWITMTQVDEIHTLSLPGITISNASSAGILFNELAHQLQNLTLGFSAIGWNDDSFSA